MLAPFLFSLVVAAPVPDDPESAFEALTGADLVWSRDDVPSEVLFDRTPELSAKRRVAAARVLLREARKYPPRFFAHIGLKRVGVFAACVSNEGDGFRPYDAELGGYRYYGLWSPIAKALIAAYYTDGQLPQTFHHEVFHHIDGTVRGETDYGNFAEDDARFSAAIAGDEPYTPPTIAADIRKELSKLRDGVVLDAGFGGYAKKSPGEDQAEAARWFMTHPADALLQVVSRPDLGGSQRIMHLLTQYAGAADGGVQADLDWFIERALGREAEAQATPLGAEQVARDAVAHVRERIRPRDGDTVFTVWQPHDFRGGTNTVLQADIGDIARAASMLGQWSTPTRDERRVLRAAQDELLGLLDRYRAYIAGSWDLSDSTAVAFERARRVMVGALVPLEVEGSSRDNPYLHNVDDTIADPRLRAAIRGVQPAAVKIGNGSGVNLQASGLVLTNAHVAENVGDVLTVTFPDGARHRGTTIASDHGADLALVRLEHVSGALPVAPVARVAPAVGDRLVAIGQPGTRTPSGEPTGYQGWHVSLGTVRGFRADALGDQSLGGLKHDAWTYWGHSGSPLFNSQGAIAGLHNSWDSTTAMRHGVPHPVIVRFLAQARVSYQER